MYLNDFKSWKDWADSVPRSDYPEIIAAIMKANKVVLAGEVKTAELKLKEFEQSVPVRQRELEQKLAAAQKELDLFDSEKEQQSVSIPVEAVGDTENGDSSDIPEQQLTNGHDVVYLQDLGLLPPDENTIIPLDDGMLKLKQEDEADDVFLTSLKKDCDDLTVRLLHGSYGTQAYNQERRRLVLTILNNTTWTTRKEMADLFNCSIPTISGDIMTLNKEGKDVPIRNFQYRKHVEANYRLKEVAHLWVHTDDSYQEMANAVGVNMVTLSSHLIPKAVEAGYLPTRDRDTCKQEYRKQSTKAA